MGKDHIGHPAGSGKLKDESIRPVMPAESLEGVDVLKHPEEKDELPYSIREKYFDEKRNNEDSTDADDRQ
jgi:hypothetical protein